MENRNKRTKELNNYVLKQIKSRYTSESHSSQIKWSYSVKYLEIHIDKQMKFAKQVNHAANKAQASKFMLHSDINAKSPLSINIKLQIYKTYIVYRSHSIGSLQIRHQMDNTEQNLIYNPPDNHRSRTVCEQPGHLQRDAKNVAKKLKHKHHEHLADIGQH